MNLLVNHNTRTALLAGLIISLVIGILLPLKHQRHKVKIVSRENVVTSDARHYFDLDNDGLSECIGFVNNNLGKASFKLFSHEGKILGQHNLDTHFVRRLPLAFFKDYDNYKLTELFFLTINRDSLFLNGFSFKTETFFIKSAFIDLVPVVDGVNDFGAHIFSALDTNNDNSDEIFIHIAANFTMQPRRLYRYDIKNQDSKKSPESYSAAIAPMVIDLDGDGKMEILCDNSSPKNSVGMEGIPYPDTVNWIFVFNEDLEFIFEPLSFPAASSRISLEPIKTGTDYNILCLYTNRGIGDIRDFLMIMDIQGNELKRTDLPPTSNNISHQIIPLGADYEKFLLCLSDGKQYIVDANLSLTKKGKVDRFIHNSGLQKTLILIQTPALFLRNPRQDDHAIASTDLKSIVRLGVPVGETVCSVKNTEDDSYLFIQDTETSYLISYSKNSLYLAGFAIYPSLFLLFSILFYLILESQQKRIVKQYETEKRLSELQFQNIKNQLNPHFTFNILNSIGYMVRSSEPEEAYNFLSKNAGMIRKLLNDANKITIPLENEIGFVRDYLALQELRFKERYSYKIYIDENVDTQIQIPKMILHTYAENAIKHGLSGRKEGGQLDISISAKGRSSLLLDISDNGAGMHSVSKGEGTGSGLKIMDEYYRLFEKYYGYKISIQTTETHPEDKLFPGTRILIDIQLP